MTTFQIDVSRTYKNKEGYKAGGYRLNTSFETEWHTPGSFTETVVKEGWPYTMVHQKRPPEETGAAARGVTTPKHLENFISRQELTADDDSAAPGVIEFWLNDEWFSEYGYAFVESVNSRPEAEKGHPTIIFDTPITDPAIYKEAMKAIKYRYRRLDPLNNIDRTIYNAEGATVHSLGNICPFDVFERDILLPYRQHVADVIARNKADLATRQTEYLEARAAGLAVTDSDAIEKYLIRTVDGVINWLATRPEARHKALFSAGVMIGRLLAADWTSPYNHLLNVDGAIIQATLTNGYYGSYANTDNEILRTFADGIAWGKKDPAEPPQLYRKRGKVETATDHGPRAFELKPFTLSAEARARRDRILAEAEEQRLQALGQAEERQATLAEHNFPTEPKTIPTLATLQYDAPIAAPEIEQCEIISQHHSWTAAGKQSNYFYCNDATRCAVCRQRMAAKLGYLLNDAAKCGYLDPDGHAIFAEPIRVGDEFITPARGPGFWYAKVVTFAERGAFAKRYRQARPGGYSRPEIYPIIDAGNNKYIFLSLAPFEDMEPVYLDNDTLARMTLGATGTRSVLTFGPPRKALRDALPRYTFEIAGYLVDRGLASAVKAAHSVVFLGPVAESDIYDQFDTTAKTFDEIYLILEEVGEKSIDNRRLRGEGDHAPDYVVQSIDIVASARTAYLNVFNGTAEAKQYRRGDWPMMATLDKSIYPINDMDLANQDQPEPDEDFDYPLGYLAKIELMLQE